LITEPFSPFVWKVVIDDGSSWRMGTLSLFSPSAPPDQQRFRKADMDLLQRLMAAEGIFSHFTAFSSFMVERERSIPPVASAPSTSPVASAFSPASLPPASPVATVASPYANREYSFMDLRYIISIHSPARWIGRKDANFVLEARTDSAGQLSAWRFLDRAAQRDEAWQAPRGPLLP
jgi:hypothetical protein